jgi:regulator of sirC expression with transglutaminase-like and TPR domain
MTSSPPTTSLPAKLSKSEQTALVNLLADDDFAVYDAIRKKVVSCGPEALEWLRPHAISGDPVLRRHTLDIIKHFESKQADNQFLTFCLKHGEEFDLEKGAWLLAKTAHPTINTEAYQAMLDCYASELRERIDSQSDPDAILAAFNKYLFQELGFTGNVTNYYDPGNSYLNCVLDRRTGNPINLSLFYMLLARRLRLPVIGIGLPGHFICRYQSTAGEFYIDPFNRGQLLTKADCIKYLQRGNYNLSDDFLTPVSARRIFMRICSNLHQIYTELGLAEETGRLQHYLVALAR